MNRLSLVSQSSPRQVRFQVNPLIVHRLQCTSQEQAHSGLFLAGPLSFQTTHFRFCDLHQAAAERHLQITRVCKACQRIQAIQQIKPFPTPSTSQLGAVQVVPLSTGHGMRHTPFHHALRDSSACAAQSATNPTTVLTIPREAGLGGGGVEGGG